MTPTSFEFTVTMPGDVRLVGVVRLLATQAATYAQLPAATGEGFAGHVERATQEAVASSGALPVPIELGFSGDEGAVNVTISYEGAAPASSSSRSADGLSLDWKASGPRHICHIRQRIPA